MGDKNLGIYRKFNVGRVDGLDMPGEKHQHCFYFVLDVNHDPFAIPALLTYVEKCRLEYPQLAADLLSTIAKLSVPSPKGEPKAESSRSAPETGWVIEVQGSKYSPITYWAGFIIDTARDVRSDVFTYNHLEAVRFTRKQDACAILDGIKVGVGSKIMVTEHRWG